MQNASYFGPVLTKFEVSYQRFIEVHNTKFHRHPSSGSCANTRG